MLNAHDIELAKCYVDSAKLILDSDKVNNCEVRAATDLILSSFRVLFSSFTNEIMFTYAQLEELHTKLFGEEAPHFTDEHELFEHIHCRLQRKD